MARPQKAGIDYFSLDVQMDDNVAIIETEHGFNGFGVLIKLYQKIYSEGYFYPWTEKEQILFCNRDPAVRNQVTTIVSDCIKWGIFDKAMYDNYNILTSRGIQKRYIAATYKRAEVEMIGEYLLVDVSDRNNIKTTSISDDGNTATTIVTDDDNTQSKAKRSKAKERKTSHSSTTNIQAIADDRNTATSNVSDISPSSKDDRNTATSYVSDSKPSLMDDESTQSKVKESKVKKSKKESPHAQAKKNKYADNVSMTEDEYEKLTKKHGEVLTRKMIEKLDNYKGAHGKKYKNDYRAILNWVAEEILKAHSPPKADGSNQANNAVKKSQQYLKNLMQGG